MKKKPRIFAFHLLNDLSGSPKVLSQLLRGWVLQEKEVHLYTSKSQKGFLSNIPGIKYHTGWYKFQSNPWLRLFFYTSSQLLLIFNMWTKVRKEDIIYINTVLPFGAAILGKLKGCRIIYHIHESTVNPPILKWFLFSMVKYTAGEIINVSRFVKESHGIKSVPNYIVYNALEQRFLSQVLPKTKASQPQNILMVCSLKRYKGVFEFVELARKNEQYAFRLVINAPQSAIDTFFSDVIFPANLKIFPAQMDLHPFYQWADIIVNLSRPDGWVETFGLTIIEGMAYGLPAIVPPVGGILEVIEEGKTGYAVDSRNFKLLNQTLHNILSDSKIYQEMADAAAIRLKKFKEETMIRGVQGILEKPEYGR